MLLAVRYDEHVSFKRPDRSRNRYVLNRICRAGHSVCVLGQIHQKLMARSRLSWRPLFYAGITTRYALGAVCWCASHSSLCFPPPGTGTPMPRYFFHFSDGKRTFTDSIGVELTSIAAARTQAGQQIREMRDGMSEQGISDWSIWKMTVVDLGGKTVFEIGFDLKPII